MMLRSASIRPRLLARGDTPRELRTAAEEVLQFGHACLRVETIKVVNKKWSDVALQFGHACLRVETCE